MSAKTACVVGAGAAGLAALKECVREGFKTTCYELDSDVGGIWLKKANDMSNTPLTWETFVTNTSKFNNCYSDFPPDSQDPVYMTQQRMQKYFKRAAAHFGLEDLIHYNTRVIQITKTTDFEKTGRWEVFTAERGSEVAGSDLPGPRPRDDVTLSKCHREIFDFVFVCTGHFKVPNFPDIPGADTFTGTVQHSFHYASSKPFAGQNVLLVGNKLSALDVAADLANSAAQVYMALGEGTWILPRCFSRSTPWDFVFRRSILHSRSVFETLNNMLIEEAQRNFDHDKSGIRPPKPPLCAGVGLNDDLPLKLLSGRVQTYGRLVRLDGDKAHFQDGKVISGLNSIVYCTGFRPDFSFVDLDIIEENGRMELYRYVFPLKEKKRTLVFIGNVGGDFSLTCLFETQARLATRVLTGKQELPSLDKMKADVDFWHEHCFARTGKYDTIYIAVALLADLIAEEVGCYPSFWKVFWKNPTLAFRNWYGPILSAQFRLVGPDSDWETAANTCRSNYEEGFSAFRSKDLSAKYPSDGHLSRSTSLAIFSSIVAVTCYLFTKYGGKELLSRVGY